MMLSDKIAKLLNEQLINEFDNSHTYQQMAAWADIKGFSGASAFFMEQADEERVHMKGIFDYLLLMDKMPILKKVEVIKTDYNCHQDLFVEGFRLERHATKKINEIAKAAFTNDDFSTFEFIQKYIVEQREEEELFRKILDQFEILKDEANKDYFVDRSLSNIRKQVSADVGSLTEDV